MMVLKSKQLKCRNYHATPFIPKSWHETSPTSCGLSVGIVCLRTKITEFFCLCVCVYIYIYSTSDGVSLMVDGYCGFRVRVTLRLAVYLQSVPVRVRPLENQDQYFFSDLILAVIIFMLYPL
jgi:hypothetical protein